MFVVVSVAPALIFTPEHMIDKQFVTGSTAPLVATSGLAAVVPAATCWFAVSGLDTDPVAPPENSINWQHVQEALALAASVGAASPPAAIL